MTSLYMDCLGFWCSPLRLLDCLVISKSGVKKSGIFLLTVFPCPFRTVAVHHTLWFSHFSPITDCHIESVPLKSTTTYCITFYHCVFACFSSRKPQKTYIFSRNPLNLPVSNSFPSLLVLQVDLAWQESDGFRTKYLQHRETDKNEQNRKKKKKKEKKNDGFCISLRLAGHSLPLPRLAQLVPTKQL